MEAQTHTTANHQFDERNLEFNRFGLIVILLLLVGCLGGIAVGLGAIQYVPTLIAVVIPTMTTLAMILAVAPMRLTMVSAAIACTIDITLILYFTIF